jgi:hypothetical protein
MVMLCMVVGVSAAVCLCYDAMDPLFQVFSLLTAAPSLPADHLPDPRDVCTPRRTEIVSSCIAPTCLTAYEEPVKDPPGFGSGSDSLLGATLRNNPPYASRIYVNPQPPLQGYKHTHAPEAGLKYAIGVAGRTMGHRSGRADKVTYVS